VTARLTWHLLVFGLLLPLASGCEDGDWLGPVERGLRGMFNGWDMWATEAVRPYEEEMPGRVEGTVSVGSPSRFDRGKAEIDALSREARERRAALTYRRYCHHCHGPSGDGRIIVGESLEIPPADLRDKSVQSQSTEDLLEHLKTGGDLMLPLATTLSPAEMLLVIEHLRSLRDRPSKPYYSPKSTTPIK